MDTDQKNRQKIYNSLEKNFFVEAGAGTGKTSSLVRRVVSVVRTGQTSVTNIAVITFTNKATAELRNKLREEFARNSENLDLSTEERTRCQNAFDAIDTATIETLHGFASNILRTKPIEAGVSPYFRPISAIEKTLNFDLYWDKWIRTATENLSTRSAISMLISLGLRIDDIKTVAQGFHDNYYLLEGVNFSPIKEPPRRSLAKILENKAELNNLLKYKIGPPDALYNQVNNLISNIEALPVYEIDTELYLRVLTRLLPIKTRSGRKNDWDEDSNGDNVGTLIKSILGELDATVENELVQFFRWVTVPVLSSLRDSILSYAEERKRNGTPEFDDLLVWSRNVLRDEPNVRNYFRDQFSHLFLDEVQDTDPLQMEITLLLSKAIDKDSEGTSGNGIKPGKLFVVGDPKQSIYRFRKADIDQVKSFKANFTENTVYLKQNFRSDAPIIKWVNELFMSWMSKTDSQTEYIPLESQTTSPQLNSQKQGVWYFGEIEKKTSVENLRTIEAEEITKILSNSGRIHLKLPTTTAVAQEDSFATRGAKLSDICILLRDRPSSTKIEAALEEAGIPYRWEGSSNIFSSQEIKDLINCLTSIEDPSNTTALISTLKSPAFACKDEELLKFKEDRGRFNYLNNQRQPAGIVSDALNSILQYHNERLWSSIDTLLEKFLRDRKWFLAALDDQSPQGILRKYQFLVDNAREFDQSGTTSLGDYIDYLKKQQEQSGRATTSSPSNEESVRIMTIHSAKGLEFPVVILAGLYLNPNTAVPNVLFNQSKDKVEIRMKASMMTSGFESQEYVEKTLASDELVRMYYVASTRAKHHLILSMVQIENKECPASEIKKHLAGKENLWYQFPNTEDLQSNSDVGSKLKVPIDTYSRESRANWIKTRSELLKIRATPISISATKLAQIEKDENQDLEPWRRGRAGTSLGRAVHSVLQTIDLSKPEEIRDICQAQAFSEGIPDRVNEIIGFVKSACESQIVKRAIKSNQYWREVPVAAPITQGSIDGFIDLLFEEADGYTIVDYKTDSINNSDIKDLTVRYRLQGGLYAVALETVLKKPIKDIVFLFLDGPREEYMEDVRATMKEAKSIAEAYFEKL